MIFKRDSPRDLYRKRAFGRISLGALDSETNSSLLDLKKKENGERDPLHFHGPSIREIDQKDASEGRVPPACQITPDLVAAESRWKESREGVVCVVALIERMTDAECANYDPLGTGDPYWQRLWHADLSPCSVSEGPTYVVAPDLTRLVQVHLSLRGAIPVPQIGACEIDVLTDDDVPDIEGIRAYVAIKLIFRELPPDLEQHLERLPFKAYRITEITCVSMASCSILDFYWRDVLPDLKWR